MYKKTTRQKPDHWHWQDIEYSHITLEQVKQDELLFYLLTASSFVEFAADVYTNNLIAHYQDDHKAGEWLANIWLKEEVQHGHALREYIRHVWPEFDWDQAYQGFFAEYSALCTMDELESGKAREMAARCVVEMATSTFYTMLNNYTPEPVLKQITHNIKQDEASHYREFRKLFITYNAAERNGRVSLLKTLFKRFNEAEGEDALIAFKHVYLTCHPGSTFSPKLYEDFVREARQKIVRPYYPYKMAVRMLLSLLDLNKYFQKLIEPLMVRTARLIFFR